MKSNRRNFLKKTSLVGAGLALTPNISKSNLFSTSRPSAAAYMSGFAATATASMQLVAAELLINSKKQKIKLLDFKIFLMTYRYATSHRLAAAGSGGDIISALTAK